MKRKIAVLFTISALCCSTLIFTACGDDGKKVSSQKEITASENSSTNETENTEATEGKIVEQDGIRKEPVATNKELNIKGETGPMKYTIEGVQVSKLTATTDDAANLLEIEKNKEVTVIAVNASAENTSDDTVNFYLDQATLTTDTKEQVESDMFLGEYIDGEYIGNVIHSGSMVYILKNSKADDIGKISLHIDAPLDEDFNTIGDNVTVDINIK